MWLIVYTHEVQPDATTYGTTPDALARLLRRAADAGLDLLPVSEVWDKAA
jgi:hypothetical protein